MQMKFKAHQSFAIRKGWLSKGLHAITKPNFAGIFMPSNSKAAMDELGLGSNQVVALRYWLQTLGLVESKSGAHNREQELTMLGLLVYENDPYIEEVGTLCALQCNLASAAENATSWYYFFNKFDMSVFSKDDFVRGLEHYIFNCYDKKEISLKSLEDDFNCIINTYISHYQLNKKLVSPESVIDCPLNDLNLISVENRSAKLFRKTPPNSAILPALMVLYCICAMKERYQDLEREIKLSDLTSAEYSPGRIFNLDTSNLLVKLYELENDGYIRINRTAGLDVIRLSEPQLTAYDCLARYYDFIG